MYFKEEKVNKQTKFEVLDYCQEEEVMADNNNLLQLNLVINNLLICVLVKTFEVVFTGLAVTVNQTR